MPEFTVIGVDKLGKRIQEKLDAPTEGDLRVMLRTKGIRPTKILKSSAKTKSTQLFSGTGGGSVSMQNLVTFTRQLQVLLSSGVPVVQALEVLGDQASARDLRGILIKIKERVAGGSYLWEAFNMFPGAFPKLFVALVRAGEVSGSLDSMLKRIGRYLEDANRLRKILKSALIYPVMVIVLGMGVTIFMLTFVIPKFEDMLKGSGQELPGPTQFVIDLSHFVSNNWHILFLGSGALLFAGYRYFKTDEGRAVFDRTFFRLPLFGELMQKAGIARFSRTMQTLLSSGINLLDAIDICRATIDNRVMEVAVQKIRIDVEGGKTLGGVCDRLDIFPKMAVQMIKVGESTGNLDKMLEKLADFYETEVEALVQGMIKLIEPLLLVVLGAIVGGLLIAMYLPIFKLAGSQTGG